MWIVTFLTIPLEQAGLQAAIFGSEVIVHEIPRYMTCASLTT